MEKIQLPECKPDLSIGRTWLKSDDWTTYRVVLSRSLPLCFIGATPPRPDPGHPPSMVFGILKRFGFKPPEVDRRFKREFTKFVKIWLKRNVKPLTPDNIMSFDGWIDQSPYPEARRKELRQLWQECGGVVSSKGRKRVIRMVKSFIKDETYEEYKAPRLINSRVDQAKCLFGPIVQSVSDEIYSNPYFIKKIPVSDRPRVIRDNLVGMDGDESGDYIYTDYTSFEAHFTPEVMRMTQVLLFQHMLKDCSQEEWLRIYESAMTGRNKLIFKYLSAAVDGTRMSGEMDTSLSNGFSNLMIFLFICSKKGARCENVRGFVEGDDGLFRVTPASAAPTKQDFEKLGFTIKIGHTNKLSEASFCGQVYDMSDLGVVTDPREVMARLGWTNKKYVECSEKTALQLLRAKGYSLLYQYPGCPILGALGKRILEITMHVVIEGNIIKNLDLWERAKLIQAMQAKSPQVNVGQATRHLVAKLYDIPVHRQMELETWISTLTLGFHQLPHECFKNSWEQYYSTYSADHRVQDPAWLNKTEGALLRRLAAYPNCSNFIGSL